MNAQGTLRRIEQLRQEGKTTILGNMVLHLVEEDTPQKIAELTRDISRIAENHCVYIDPVMAKSQAARMIFKEAFQVRFAVHERQHPHQAVTVYDVFLGRRGYHFALEADPDLLEEILKREIETLNGLGLNLEYAGQCVPPD